MLASCVLNVRLALEAERAGDAPNDDRGSRLGEGAGAEVGMAAAAAAAAAEGTDFALLLAEDEFGTAGAEDATEASAANGAVFEAAVGGA